VSSPTDATPALERFRRGVAAGRVAHAYLVAGAPRGEGGELARAMLQTLFCDQAPGACGACRSCRLVAERIHPDVRWIEPELKSRRIAIKALREDMIPHLTETSLEGGWKAGVILAADRLSDEAANAFLKTLEEPPPKTIVLLVTDTPQDIQPTLASRCQRIAGIEREAPAPDPWRTRLLDLLAVGAAGGAIGRLGSAAAAAALFAEVEKSVGKDIAPDDEDEDDAKGDVRLARERSRYIEARSLLLREIVIWQRDVLAVVLGLPDNALRNRDRSGAVRRDAAGLDYASAVRRLRDAETMDARFARNLSDATVLAAFFRDLPAATPARQTADAGQGRRETS